MERSKVGIIIPALNEAGTIEGVVECICQYGQAIVVDDGSMDSTAEIARNAGAIVLSHAINKGYDEALNTGFNYAAEMGYDYIVTIDADGQHNPEQLAEIISLLKEGNDLVLCVRDRFARISETILALFANYLWGVADPMCGMKGYATSLYRKIGYFDRHKLIGSELAVRSIVAGCKSTTVNIVVRDRVDAPRFGRKFFANYRILRAMFILILMFPSRKSIID